MARLRENKIIILVILAIAVIGVLIFVINSRNPTGLEIYEGNEVIIYEFYGEGCPHCAALNEFFESIESKYPTLTIIKKEIYFNQDNAALFQEMSKTYGGQARGVPTVFIGDKMISGFSDAIGSKIEKEIQKCLEQECISPIDMV